jgi:hypothetical protein
VISSSDLPKEGVKTIPELLHEFPELAPLVKKLIGWKPLDEVDKSNLRELVEATG